MTLDSFIFIYTIIAGSIIIGFGLVLFFVSNKIKNIRRFKIAKNLLAIYMILVGSSFYIAHAVGKYDIEGKVEVLNFSSILMYFIVTSILIASFIFMFDLRGYLNIKTLQIRALIPSTLIVIYIISTIIFGDYPIYSFKDLLKELTNHPILILRLLVFIAEIEFFFFLVRKLTFVRSSNSNMLNDIVSKDEYINKNNERYFIYGGLLLFIIMMLHYIIPGKVIDTLATTLLIIISLFFTIIVLNYQSVYERLSAIVKFVDTKDDIILDAAKTPARIIRSKLNDWSNKTCMNMNGKDLSLNAISKQINIDSIQIYEFIKYEYGLNLEQWIIQLKLRCVCNNIREKDNLQELAIISGFKDVESMEKCFIDNKHLSIEKYKELNFIEFEDNNKNHKFNVWIYNPDNRNIRMITGNNLNNQNLNINDIAGKVGDGREAILKKIANDAELGIFEERSYNYTLSENTQFDGKRYIEAKCIPLQFIEDKNPLIIGLECDITNSRSMIHKLSQIILDIDNQKTEAITSRDNRTAFLANISHDIRSPLNAVIGFSALLQSTDNDEEKAQYSNIINSSAESLLKLINDLLDLSRFDAGHIKLTNDKFELNQLYQEIYTALSCKIDSSIIEFKLSMPLESCNIVFDRVRMSQVLTNFCTNAIKFTKKGKITLGYEVLDNELKLFVKDSGYGISEANKHKVFERFERFNRSEPGTGLGLYICKSIAEEAGGKIGFESKEGVGSTFWVKLKCIQD